MPNTQITLNNYTKLLLEIKNYIQEAQNKVTREKVVLSWQIGKIIDEHLSKNIKSNYGEKLFDQLEQDINIAKKMLYKMRNFYQSYPTLPKDDNKLNWSHYRILSGIKKDQERKYFEDLTKEQGWGTNRLQQEVTKSKNILAKKSKEEFAKKDTKNTTSKKKAVIAKLNYERGQLFSYPLIKLDDTGKSCIDLGFNIFREVKENLPNTSAIEVVKKKETYSFIKSNSVSHKFNTYKAYLERVVDGDTIRVTLDLGFETFHKEILRLRGIDAPEMSSAAGKKSFKILKDILKDIPFLIIKTTKIDIYGRYVADVYVPTSKDNIDPTQVADEGVYLNQLLLDRGLVRML